MAELTDELCTILDTLANRWYAYHPGATVEVGGRVYEHPTLTWAVDGRPAFGAYQWSVSFETDEDPRLPYQPTQVTYRCRDFVLTGQCRPSVHRGDAREVGIDLYGVGQLEVSRG